MRALLLILLLLAACGRPLSEGERALASSLFGEELDPKPVSVAPFKALETLTQRRPPRPRLTCREKIWPPPQVQHGKVKTFTAAFVLQNKINIAAPLYAPDYLAGYPDRISLPAAMLIAHEMTHVWQWQNRAETGYSPMKALNEHGVTEDPYLFDADVSRAFLDYGYEQQGAIVEEFVCCQTLDPNGARTQRLRAMLGDVMPVAGRDGLLPGAEVILPWKDVQLAGICG